MNAIVGALVDAAKGKTQAQERLAEWFLMNASATHGVPLPDKTKDSPSLGLLSLSATPKPPESPVTPPELPPVADSKPSPWKLGAGIAAVLATIGALGVGAGSWMSSDDEKPVAPAVIEQPIATPDRSLLQALEDEGRHLPGGGG